MTKFFIFKCLLLSYVTIITNEEIILHKYAVIILLYKTLFVLKSQDLLKKPKRVNSRGNVINKNITLDFLRTPFNSALRAA